MLSEHFQKWCSSLETIVTFIYNAVLHIGVDPAGVGSGASSGLSPKGATYVWPPRCFDLGCPESSPSTRPSIKASLLLGLGEY